MKKVFLSIVALAALVVLPMSVSAQNTAVLENVGTRVNIIEPLVLAHQNSQPLNFGTIVKGVNLVTLSSAAARTAQNESNLVAGADAPTVPIFRVTGQKNQAITTTISSGGVLHLDGNASGTTLIANLEHNAPAKIDATNGYSDFSVFGTLTLDGSETVGLHENVKFNVTVNYN